MKKEVLIVTLIISLFMITACQVPVGGDIGKGAYPSTERLISANKTLNNCESYNKFGAQKEYVCVQDSKCVFVNKMCVYKNCVDGTRSGQCSSSQDYGLPYLCNDKRELIQDCFGCGCLENFRCVASGSCEKDVSGVNINISTDRDIYFSGEKIGLSSTGRAIKSDERLTVNDVLPTFYKGREDEITNVLGSKYIGDHNKRSDFDGYIVLFNEPSGIEHKKALERVSAKRVGGSIEQDVITHIEQLKEIHNSVFEGGNGITGNQVGRSIIIKAEYYSVANGAWVDGNSEAMERLRKDPRIKSVTPSYMYYSLQDMESKENNFVVPTSMLSQDINLTGKDVKVAILDTGIDYMHKDFGECKEQQIKAKTCKKVIDGYNTVDDNNDIFDDNGHGTHVAGIIASNGAIKGIAPEAKLMIYKVLDESGSGSEGSVIAGLERAIDPNQDYQYEDRADIVSMSLGGPAMNSPDDDIFRTPMDNIISTGAIIVVAAGNEGPSLGSIGSPALLPKIITVGAYCSPEQLWKQEYCKTEYPYIAEFSSRGPSYIYDKPDIVAPGVDVCATKASEASEDFGKSCYDGAHIMLSGTSMATPHVTGAVALIKQVHPDWNNEMVKNALKNTAKDLGYPRYIQGSGLIDVKAALEFNNKISLEVTGIGGGEYKNIGSSEYESL